MIILAIAIVRSYLLIIIALMIALLLILVIYLLGTVIKL